jgi:NTP pyrophosphatase (non-canonical NTP hydrolase)
METETRTPEEHEAIRKEFKEHLKFSEVGDITIKIKRKELDEKKDKIFQELQSMLEIQPVINFTSYQKQAHTTAIYLDGVKKENPQLPPNIIKMLAVSYIGLGMGEVGETQNKLKKIIRDKNGIITDEIKMDIKKELGDILWYVAEMCTELNLDMANVAQANINKLFKRKDEGKIKGSGDNR